MFRPSTLVVALIFAAPVLYQGFTDPHADTVAVLLRFLVALPVAAVLLGLVRLAAGRVTSGPAEPATPRTRRKA
ncbi:MAG: hypothetical protein ACTHMS_18195 [Jatrophihabitans sp.]|uniref:hypothetical protein n=1 Tax=Jatrophihabitans sp. TaxID=1932789 RepID=UPI003F811A8A